MKKIIALFTIIVLLSSQVGYTISTHYCGGEVSDRGVYLIDGQLGCGMESMGKSCTSKSAGISKKSCCENDSKFYQLNENFQQKHRTVDAGFEFIAFFTVNYFQLLNRESVLIDSPFLPTPPLLQQCTQVLFQIFLI